VVLWTAHAPARMRRVVTTRGSRRAPRGRLTPGIGGDPPRRDGVGTHARAFADGQCVRERDDAALGRGIRLGVRLALRGGFAYVQIRPRKDVSRVLVQVNADEPDVEPPPSSSLVRLSRWIRERLWNESRRQAEADREWAAKLAPDAADGDVRIERAPGSLTIVLERPVLPSIDDIEALVQKAEQKLAS